MRTILFLLQKEFIQIFRNKTMLPLIFILPVVQLVILVNAATSEMKEIKMVVTDFDLSTTSRQLIEKFTASPFYKIEVMTVSRTEANNALLNNSADVIMEIPDNFEQNLKNEGTGNIQFRINAINGMAAGLIASYSAGIVSSFSNQVLAQWFDLNQQALSFPVVVKERYWYNPELRYTIYMLPGILVILVTVIGMFLTALNLVREKEIGTIEQINVTPIRKSQFLIGKLIPFLIIAIFELCFGLLIGRLFFAQPVEGQFVTILALAFVYLLLALGLGLLLSTISDTQQQIMFSVYFFMLVFIMMSGIFTPTESMPQLAQYVNYLNPFYYFMRGIRMILLKGSGFADLKNEFIALATYGAAILTLAIYKYRKTV